MTPWPAVSRMSVTEQSSCYALGQGAGLVEDHRLHAAERVHEIGALDQDTLPGGTADAPEEREGHGDDQRAGAGYHQEHQRPVDPGGPFTRDEGGNQRQQDGQAHDDGRIDLRELGDEALALGFVLRGVFHEVQDLRGGGLAERLRRADAEDAGKVHAPGQDLIVLADAAGHALAREGDRVQAGSALEDDTVHGHLLAGLDDDDLALLHGLRLHGQDRAVPFDMGGIRPDVHRRCLRTARPPGRTA